MKDSQPAVMSAKLRTRSKFDLLLKTALEERKLDQTLDVIEPLKKEKEAKPKKKKSKKPKRNQGITNPSFDDGNNFELKPIRRSTSSSRNQKKTADDEHLISSANLAPSIGGYINDSLGDSKNDVSLVKHDQLNYENEISPSRMDESNRATRRQNKSRKTESRKSHISSSATHNPIASTTAAETDIDGSSSQRPLAAESAIDAENDAVPEKTTRKTPKAPSRKKKSRSERLIADQSEGHSMTAVPVQSIVVDASSTFDVVSDNVAESVDPVSADAPTTAKMVSQPDVVDDDDRILSVKVHRVDRLRVNLTIKHPLVRIHVVDATTGTYFNQTRRTNSATAVATTSGESSSMDSLQPAMTQPFDIKTKRSFVPVWEEEVLFPANFGRLTQSESNIVIFFEILDFVSMSRAQNQYRKLGADSGWYRIAWAFLKLVGSNGTPNTNCKAQLQLFHFPKQNLRPVPRVLDIFQYWSSTSRDPYPSTLYVTVGSHTPANTSGPLSNPQIRTSRADDSSSPHSSTGVGKLDTSKLTDGTTSQVNQNSLVAEPSPQWSRLPGQSCKIPNAPHLNFPATTSSGCFAICFSPNGRLCACACHKESSTEIIIYGVVSGELMTRLKGHCGLVYGLQFSAGNDLLLSPSSDGSARVWRIESRSSKCAQVLPHPSYVYASIFHPLVSSVVATGCYDTVVRIWSINKVSSKYGQLMQELEGHRSRVNALCFGEDGVMLFSGDGAGVIRQWSSRSGNRSSTEGESNCWIPCQEIKIPDLKDVPITNFFMHPTLNRLFFQSLDCVIRAMDVASSRIIQEYRSFLNIHEHVRGCITPCGNFIFSGSEDHCVYVWNVLTGARVTVYDDLPFGQTVHCVAYHPLDHLVAFGCYGSGCPVLIYKYNIQAPPRGVNLVLPASANSASLLSPKLSATTTPSIGVTMRPLGASTPMRKLPEAPLQLSDTATSATCLEKIMRKLDSVLETTNLTTKLNGTSCGYASSDMLEYGENSMMHSMYNEMQTSHVSRDGVKELWTSQTNIGNDHQYQDDREKPKNVSALLTKSGELAFLSDSDESIEKMNATANRRERRRQRTKHIFDDDESN